MASPPRTSRDPAHAELGAADQAEAAAEAVSELLPTGRCCGRGAGAAGAAGGAKSALTWRKCALLAALGAFAAVAAHVVYIRQYDAKQCSLAAIVCADRVFRDHGIDYFLDYGSLLGAVRHGGFIPWDGTGDIDVGVFRADEARIKALAGEFWQRCGMPLLHRSQVSLLPSVTSFVIRRGAFRLFCAPAVPYYVDFADYETEDDPLEGGRVVVDHHYYPHSNVRHPESDVLPIRDCKFDQSTFRCPAKAENVLRTIYGDDWRVPNPDYYDNHVH